MRPATLENKLGKYNNEGQLTDNGYLSLSLRNGPEDIRSDLKTDGRQPSYLRPSLVSKKNKSRDLRQIKVSAKGGAPIGQGLKNGKTVLSRVQSEGGTLEVGKIGIRKTRFNDTPLNKRVGNKYDVFTE